MRIILSADYVSGEDVTGGAVFPCRADDGDVLLTCGNHPAILRVNLIVLLKDAAADHLIDELVGEVALAFGLSLVPNLYEVLFKTAESLFFGDTGICNAVVVVVKEFLLLKGSEVTVTGNPVVVAVGHKVHNVFLKVVCAAAHKRNLVLADHFRKGDAEFCGGHCTCHGKEHFATLGKKIFIGLCCVYQRSSVEMTVIVGNEL